MYGAQTLLVTKSPGAPFENDVEMYGAQTKIFFVLQTNRFENDVEMYGAQTYEMGLLEDYSLRMM